MPETPPARFSLPPPKPARWCAGGCTFVENATLGCDQANVVWSAALDPDALAVVARPVRDGQRAFDLAAFGGRAAIVPAGNGEYAVLRGARGYVRLDVLAGTLRSGPVRLLHRLTTRAELDLRLPALRQLAAFCELGPAAPWIIPEDPRLNRLIQALRALDARAEGASLRDIGLALASRTAGWPGEGESTKSWARRLVALSEELRRVGPRGVIGRAI